ncbi:MULTISPECIES: hypothetical protein [Arcicella]|uniref:Uncharacterized protein n=2 Tax=Arcicella TaxID=217140 RepID=A0ABU5SDM4_9BACT|nr:MULTISPECIES: hypothetical protein [unclassified Arcicella]MEA5402625.1 hypothetical protein [Arcicella sp. DC2W]MEA5425377.1 hypothetical protein [Arcicella sp. DC25W]
MGNNFKELITIMIGLICSGFVGLIVYVFTSNSNITSKRIDTRSKENEENAEEISNVKIAIKGLEGRIVSLENGQAKNEKLLNEKIDRLEQKIDKLFQMLLHSKLNLKSINEDG